MTHKANCCIRQDQTDTGEDCPDCLSTRRERFYRKMEDFYINNTSVNESYNNSDIGSNYKTYLSNIRKLIFIKDVVLCIIISISLPLTLVAIYGLYSQVRNGHVAPIYIINLLISDLIQLCFMFVYVAKPATLIVTKTLVSIYMYGLTASVCFMVCIALERYLVITWPLWYRFRRTIKTSVVVCVVVWVLPLPFILTFSFGVEPEAMEILLGVFLLLPLPLLIFFLFGTIKALSAAISVPPDEKRRIVAILILVLLIYTLLFLPSIIWQLAEETRSHYTFTEVTVTLMASSPLADLFLYVFSKKGVADKFLACVCRCRMNSDSDTSRTTA